MTDAAHQLRCYVERIERLDAEAAEIRADRRDVLAEAKAHGFDTKTINSVVKRRKIPFEQREAADAMLELYEHALGMGGPDMIDATPSLLALPAPDAPTPANKQAAELSAWLSGGIG